MTRFASQDSGNGGARRSALLRLPLVLLCLLSLTVQGYLIQTHFHPAAERLVAGSHDTGGEKQPPADAAHCFICHQAAAAGAYLLAVPSLHVAPRLVLVFVPLIAQPSFTVRAVSHRWHGRGPPRF
jgi:hypothetical protein